MSKYSAADEGAIADLTGTPAETPVNTSTPEPESQATPETPETTEEAKTEPDTQTPAPETPTDTFEGRYKDLQKVFTKNTQKLKTTEEENAQLKEYVGRVNAWLRSQQANSSQQIQPDAEPELPTVAQVQDIVRQTIERERSVILSEADKRIAAAKIEEYKFQYAKEIGKYAQELVESEPLLKSLVEDSEDTSLHESMIKYAQTKLFGPQADEDAVRDVDAFKAEMKTFATRKVKSLQKLVSNHEQAAMARAVKANKPSMAPTGGKTPAAQAPNKAPKMNTPEFQDYLAQGLLESVAVEKSRK